LLKVVIQRIESKTLREMVYEQLRHKIIYGDILPGQKVTLRNLAEQFGVSFIPVREALWQLETEKVIVIERNRFIRVNTLTPSEMKEALAIRLKLEADVAERACELHPPDLLPRLRSLSKEMQAATGSPREYLIKNSEYHFAIYNAADMPLHLQIINQLWARIGPYLVIHAKETKMLGQTMELHHAMLTALRKRDKKALVQALRQDLRDAAKVILPYLAHATGNGR
jgi:DNA-binding GntR family transcriptional regulator